MVTLFDVAWENILIGLFAAAIVGLVTSGKTYLYNRYLERKYPVDGQYVTTFEDEVDGETTQITAPATLSQNGKEIYGETLLSDEDRRWVLEGEISKSGYINGVYYAVDPHDRGVGNFFLYLNYNRQMDGLWSGYDEVNDKINSGKYTFVPLMEDLSIRELSRAEVPSVMDISDSQLGNNYLTIDHLERSIAGDTNFFSMVATTDTESSKNRSIVDRVLETAFDRDRNGHNQFSSRRRDDGQLIGFCIGAVYTQEELRSYLHVDADQFPEGLKHTDNVGVVRTVAVTEAYQGCGVGSQLVDACLAECERRGANALCAVGWKDGDTVNIGGVMERFHFKPAVEYDDYWHDDSLTEEYECERCGKPPCRCSAVLYTSYL